MYQKAAVDQTFLPGGMYKEAKNSIIKLAIWGCKVVVMIQ